MLANALLLRAPNARREARTVALLDLDPGQPEYSPPGELSLIRLQSYNLGPPFTHPAVSGDDQVIKAHHFGYLSSKDDPQHYYSCALDLFSHYRRMTTNQGSCPLIVNCSGWIQGSGLELLINFMHNLDLTDVIYMSTSGPAEVVDVLKEAATRTNTPLHQLSSQASEVSTRTAADLRMMQTLSYFHLDEPESGNLRWNPYPLVNILPLVVHYAGPRQDILGVMLLGDEQNPEFFDSILEGCVVSITVVEDDSAISLGRIHNDGREEKGLDTGNEPLDEEVAQNIDDLNGDARHEYSSLPRTPTGIPYIPAKHLTVGPLPPTTSYSLGQALIRGIDIQTQAFHLLTPVPAFHLVGTHTYPKRKIVLVRGRLDTPTWAFAEQIDFERERSRRRERDLGIKEENRPLDVKGLAERQPWASVVEGGRTGSGKVRRVRRDIRYKGQVPVDSSN